VQVQRHALARLHLPRHTQRRAQVISKLAVAQPRTRPSQESREGRLVLSPAKQQRARTGPSVTITCHRPPSLRQLAAIPHAAPCSPRAGLPHIITRSTARS
jgi:hypothetical protein